MKCSKCHFDNPSDSKFCKECGTQLLPAEQISAPTETLETVKEELTRGTTFAGRYEIIKELGKGGMGRVYRVFDKKVEEEIALKLLKPEIADDKRTIKRFRNELKLARKITHKNVCRMFDFHEEQETPYITMEYVPGGDLKSLVQKSDNLPEKEAIHIGKQVGEGLAEAHRLRVVHRDLKPQNIMIDKEGSAKVMDFGIARSVEAKGVTQTGIMIGTPDYMSPEQAEGKEADQRSDIYSLGIILYEMVTGKVPFEGDTALSIALMHKTEAPADPRELNDQVSEDLSGVILKCLEKNREERFQSVEDLLSELRNIEEGLPLTTAVKRPQVPEFLIEGKEEEVEEERIEEERPVFVARKEELAKLGEFLDMALSGKGHIVFVTGEAGSGKTALVQEFARQAQEAHSDLIVTSGNCNAHTGIGDPYLPFREVLALLTGDVETRWRAGAISTDHAQRLWHCLPVSGQLLVESGPELIDTFVAGGELLGRAKSYERGGSEWLRKLREVVERKATVPADPSLQQSVLFEQYARLLEALAGQKPVLLILDDLQWADGGSTSLLMHLVERIQSSRALIIGSYRLEEVAIGREGERHPLKPVVNECKAKFGDIEVEVGKEGSQEFVDAIMDTEQNRYSSAFREAFNRHTEGHSLFTLEVLRGLKEQGAVVQDEEGRWTESVVDWEKLPTRVEAMIGERIDRMPENLREVLKVASIEGEYFNGEVLAEVQKADEKEMVRLLSGELDKRYQLVRAQGVRRIDGHRLSQYRFRHILFQKYLYNSLDEVERAHLHEDVGNILERRYAEQAGEIAVQLARHFQEAGITEKAIEYLQQVAAKAVRLSANEEAIAHFGKALELLKTLPDTPERAQQELGLQLGLAASLMTTRGYAAPEVLTPCARARELCQQMGETPQLCRAFWLLITYYGLRAEFETALDLAKQALSSAKSSRDPLSIAMAHWDLGWLLVAVGEFAKARGHLERVIAFYDPKQHGSLAFFYVQDPGVSCLVWEAWASWFLGYPDQATKRSQEALALARQLDHPFSMAFALSWHFTLHHYIREDKVTKEYIEAALGLSAERGFPYSLIIAGLFQGFIQAEAGQLKEGMAQILQAIGTLKSIGIETGHSHYLALLASVYMKAGKIEEALKVLSDAQAHVEKSGEHFYEAELNRLKGEFLLVKGESEAKVEDCFRQAIDIARQQQAKSLELRATMSLARLWQKQGKKEEARKSLSEIYDWFTEGFDTPDLKDAKALLKELS